MAYISGFPGRSADAPIEVPDDDDPVMPEDQSRVDLAREVRNFPLREGHRQRVFVNPDSAASEEEQEDEIVEELKEVIDLTGDEPSPGHRNKKQHRVTRQIPPTKRHQYIHRDGKKIKVNFFYEINDTRCRHCVLGFIKVTEINERLSDSMIHVRGIPYTRNRNLKGQLPSKLNEVCMVYEVYEDDPRIPAEQAMIEVPISLVGGPRRLHITNAPFPLHRWDPKIFRCLADIESSGPLVCRWKMILHYQDGRPRRTPLPPHSFQILRIRAEEVKEVEFRYDDNKLRFDWRGETIRGGSYEAPQGVIAPGVVDRAPRQRYTLFDAFCGAGGVSRGAERSGFHVQYAVDVWDKACDSHRMNFPAAQIYESDILGFIEATTDSVMIADVVHLSPPCQFWSPAHTVNSQHDEANIAALFACRTIIEKVRPRVFTLEQTFGIMRDRFADCFNCLISGFTDYDYSVEWKVIECEYYGLPQHRRRLIIMGAGPGETLPPWPAITHSRDARSGLKPFNTIRNALRPIAQVRDDPHHRPRPCPPSKDSVVSDPDDILRRCMTTTGGQNRHFDNTRSYTNREFACLQGFPIWHQFSKTFARRQIGNAFPPCVVQVFYETIQEHLYRADGFTGNPRPVLPVVPQDIINLVDADVVDVDSDVENDDDGSLGQATSGRETSRAASVVERQVILLSDDDDDDDTEIRPAEAIQEAPASSNPRRGPCPPRSRPDVNLSASRQIRLRRREEQRRRSVRLLHRKASRPPQHRLGSREEQHFRPRAEQRRRSSRLLDRQDSRPSHDRQGSDVVEIPGPLRSGRRGGVVGPWYAGREPAPPGFAVHEDQAREVMEEEDDEMVPTPRSRTASLSGTPGGTGCSERDCMVLD
ncbi:hypothetical protein ACHAQA_002262 [Verticillium albo-atrum]